MRWEPRLIADAPLWRGFFLVLRLTNNKDGREMCDFADQKPVILTRTTNLWVRAKIVQAAGTSPKIGNARFRSVLGACGMHGRVRAGRRRRCGRVQGHVSPRPSGTPAARSAARPRPLGRTSPDSPFCVRLDVRLDACIAQDWRSQAGQFDTGLNGAGQGRPRAR